MEGEEPVELRGERAPQEIDDGMLVGFVVREGDIRRGHGLDGAAVDDPVEDGAARIAERGEVSCPDGPVVRGPLLLLKQGKEGIAPSLVRRGADIDLLGEHDLEQVHVSALAALVRGEPNAEPALGHAQCGQGITRRLVETICAPLDVETSLTWPLAVVHAFPERLAGWCPGAWCRRRGGGVARRAAVGRPESNAA